MQVSNKILTKTLGKDDVTDGLCKTTIISVENNTEVGMAKIEYMLYLLKEDGTRRKKVIKERLIQTISEVLGGETDNWEGATINWKKETFEKEGQGTVEYADIENVKQEKQTALPEGKKV